MKKCVRCGKPVADDSLPCEKCIAELKELIKNYPKKPKGKQ